MAARNAVHDFLFSPEVFRDAASGHQGPANAQGREMLSQYFECVGGQRHVEFISSLAKSFKDRVRHISNLQRASHTWNVERDQSGIDAPARDRHRIQADGGGHADGTT
jgi:hypothetical protein